MSWCVWRGGAGVLQIQILKIWLHPGKQGCPSLVLVKILLDAGADVYAKYRGKSMKEIVELSSNNTAAQANAFDMVIAMLDVSRCAGIFVQ